MNNDQKMVLLVFGHVLWWKFAKLSTLCGQVTAPLCRSAHCIKWCPLLSTILSFSFSILYLYVICVNCSDSNFMAGSELAAFNLVNYFYFLKAALEAPRVLHLNSSKHYSGPYGMHPFFLIVILHIKKKKGTSF